MFSIDPSNDTLAQVIRLLHARKNCRYLLAKALLMAGRIEETLEIAYGCEPVGWSYGDNPGGLCFAAILALPVLDHLDEHPIICELLKTYAGSGGNERPVSEQDAEKVCNLVFEEIRRGIGSATLSAGIRARYLEWAQDIGENGDFAPAPPSC